MIIMYALLFIVLFLLTVRLAIFFADGVQTDYVDRFARKHGFMVRIPPSPVARSSIGSEIVEGCFVSERAFYVNFYDDGVGFQALSEKEEVFIGASDIEFVDGRIASKHTGSKFSLNFGLTESIIAWILPRQTAAGGSAQSPRGA